MVKTLQIQIVVDDQGNVQKILAVDEATERIAKRLPVLKQSAREAGEQGIRPLADELAKIVPHGQDVLTLFDKIGKGGVLAMAGATAAVGGFAYAVVDAINQTASWAHEIESLSRQTGIALGPLQNLGNYAQASGVGTQELATAIGMLARRINDPSGGGGAVAAIDQLGLSVDSLRQSNPYEMFLSVAEAVGRVTDQSDKATFAVNLFGRSGLAIRGTLTPAIRETIEELNRYQSVSDATIQRYAEYDKHTKLLADSWRTFKAEALLPLVPLLDGLIEQTRRWVSILPSSQGGLIPGMTPPGVRAPTLADAQAAANTGAMATAVQFDLGKGLGQIGGGPTTAPLEATEQFANRMAALRAQVQPFSGEVRALIGELKEYGLSTGEVVELVRKSGLAHDITAEQIQRYEKQVEIAKQADQTWGETQKALALAMDEGLGQALRVAEAAHLTRQKLIQDEVLGAQDRTRLLANEAARYAAELLSVQAEANSALKSEQEASQRDRAALEASYFHDRLVMETAALDAQYQAELDAASKRYGATEQFLARAFALEATHAEKRKALWLESETDLVRRLDAIQVKLTGGRLAQGLPVELSGLSPAQLAGLNLPPDQAARLGTTPEGIQALAGHQAATRDIGGAMELAARLGDTARLGELTAAMAQENERFIAELNNLIPALQQATGATRDQATANQTNAAAAASVPPAIDEMTRAFATFRGISFDARSLGAYQGTSESLTEAGFPQMGSVGAVNIQHLGMGLSPFKHPTGGGVFFANPGGGVPMTINIDARGARFENEQAMNDLADAVAQRLATRARL